jgi:molecular chaperone GrpE
MTDENRPEAHDGASEPQAAEPTVEKLAKLEAESADMRDRLLRTLADMENLRRRTEKEVKDSRDYAITGFARDLLAVSDNLARALAALPAEARDGADGAVKSFADGVDMTGRELLKVLEKHGVKKLEPLGSKFDPNVHQAMFEVPNAEVANGTVLQVLQDGFVIGDRVLRPALVGVAKNAAKSKTEESPSSGASVDRTV